MIMAHNLLLRVLDSQNTHFKLGLDETLKSNVADLQVAYANQESVRGVTLSQESSRPTRKFFCAKARAQCLTNSSREKPGAPRSCGPRRGCLSASARLRRPRRGRRAHAHVSRRPRGGPLR
jgi:hypothetical protein